MKRNRNGRLAALGLTVLSLAVVRPAHAAPAGAAGAAGAADIADAAGVWVPLGPSGGTVAVLAIDPLDSNTVYAGTQGAGVYRSANGGRTWQPAGPFGGGTGGVALLAVAPGTRAVYAVAGSGDASTLYRSSDGGSSWVSLGDSLRAAAGTSFVQSLALSTVPGTVYAVVPQGPPTLAGAEILQSTDGGDTWRPVFVPPSGVFLFRVFADPGDAYVYAGTSNGVYTSADGGTTWSAGTLTGDVLQLGIEKGPRHRLLAAVSNGNPHAPQTQIHVSADRGRTWRLRDGLRGEPLQFLLGDPTTPGAFDALGSRGILRRTTDAGITWASLGPVPHPQPTQPPALDLALDPVHPGLGFVAVSGGALGRTVWKTATFGEAWTPFIRGLFAGDFLSVTPVPPVGNEPGTLWAVATPFTGSPYGLWKSADRGVSWGTAGFNFSPSSLVAAFTIAGTSPSLFANVVGQGFLRSDDGGGHWTPVALKTTDIHAILNVAQEPNTLYVLDNDELLGALDISLDKGATWTARSLNAGILAVAAGSPTTLYANSTTASAAGPGIDDFLQRSTDRGATWTTILTVADGTLASIGTDPADPQRVVVAHRRLDALSRDITEILWTADGGATWHVGALFPQPFAIGKILPDPLVPHGFLAGTSNGAYASADGGATWAPLGAGLPAAFTELSLDPSAPHTVYAATEGGGIYRLERTNP
jgi:photosystem II stability/assembly factor-like uncharacterized protein